MKWDYKWSSLIENRLKLYQNCDRRYNLIVEIQIGRKSMIEFGQLGIRIIDDLILEAKSHKFRMRLKNRTFLHLNHFRANTKLYFSDTDCICTLQEKINLESKILTIVLTSAGSCRLMSIFFQQIWNFFSFVENLECLEIWLISFEDI